MYTGLNYAQWQGPGLPYSPTDPQTPNQILGDVLDYVRTEIPGVRFYIYENWPDAGAFAPQYDDNGIPASPEQFAAYHAYTHAEYHDWWIELHDTALLSHNNVKMIPVGPILSGLLTDIPALAAIPFEDLYEDSAPHGRPTIYFLAAMIQYSATYAQRVPTNFTVPAKIDPAVAENFSDIVTYIWEELNTFNFPGGNSRVFFD